MPLGKASLVEHLPILKVPHLLLLIQLVTLVLGLILGGDLLQQTLLLQPPVLPVLQVIGLGKLVVVIYERGSRLLRLTITRSQIFLVEFLEFQDE